ncbi:CocE/NonD family hydrolase [Streptomyces syringium]|uniref:CocE/NonD family hydrolase n=1 Tax=Streptomyces syringium TaxID=76729 RepID=UPI0036ECD043
MAHLVPPAVARLARRAARRRDLRRQVRRIAVVSVLLGVLVTTAAARPAPTRAQPPFTWRQTVIPGTDGAPLLASVAEPAGPGPHPLVVMPLPWAAGEEQFRRAQLTAARDGYTFLLYGTRGTHQSGGATDLGGPKDIADVSRVIDWALAHTSADARRIATMGLSYGAGISLLGAAFDRRISCALSMSGWTDMNDVLQNNGTPTLGGLVFTSWGSVTAGADRRGAPLRDFVHWDPARLAAWARPRSPASYLDRYNARGTALYFAHSWGDSSTPAGRLGEFFDDLRVTKRLEMRSGDHGGAEFSANVMPNEVFTSAMRWLDHTLKGQDNGVAGEPAVRIRPVNGGPLFGAGRPYEEYPSWAAMTAPARRLFLNGSRSLAGSPGPSDTHVRLVAGAPTVADSGVIGLQATFEAAIGAQVPRPLALVPPGTGALWATEPYPDSRSLRGTPRLHPTLTPTAPRGTIVAYLYDLDPLGFGRLMTYAPYTFDDRTPGTAFTADFPLRPTAYDVPAGHRIALVITTTDSRSLSRNPPLAALTLSSSGRSPSSLTLPLR